MERESYPVEVITDDPTDYARRKGKKKAAGGWLALKPPGNLEDYFYTTNGDPNWFEMKGIRRVMQVRLATQDGDLERALRVAAENAKGFTREERDHMLAAADKWAENKATRQADATAIPETSDERLARIIAEQMGVGFERVAAIMAGVNQAVDADAETETARGPGRPRKA